MKNEPPNGAASGRAAPPQAAASYRVGENGVGPAAAPLVSVIVTSYSLVRLGDVQDLLDSLRAQTAPNLEIIFVGERARELCALVLAYADEKGIDNVQAVFNDGRPGLSAARNVGVRAARGSIVAFIDDDAVAAPDWAERIVRRFEGDPAAIGATGPAFPLWPDGTAGWLPEELYWAISCTPPKSVARTRVARVRNAWGVNMAFRREAFEHCVFSEAYMGGNHGATQSVKGGLVGDDTEFCLRLGEATNRPILFDPTIQVRHKVPASRLTARSLRRRSFWEGYTKAKLARRGEAQRRGGIDLGSEYALLRQIALRLLPRTAALFLRRPRLACRRLAVTADAVFHVGLGFCSEKFPLLGERVAARYR